MAQSVTTDVGTFIVPGAYTQITVENSASGLATTGVLMIVGEADQGPDFSAESDISLNSFGPDQLAEVQSKYKSGSIVDAFRGASQAANDPEIAGSFSRAILIKTNPSTKASGPLLNFDASAYATIQDRSYGKMGNQISREVVTKQAEVAPTTGKFAFLPAIASTNIDVRVNGGAATAITIAAQATPLTVKAQIDAVPGIDVDGGTDNDILGTSGSPISGNLALTVLSGNTVRVDFSVNFGSIPATGDTLWIKVGSAIAGGSNHNCGSYIVTAATAATITARKLIDASGTPNQLTAPSNVSSTPAVDNTDVMSFAALTVRSVTADPVVGVGKSIEINELTSGTGLLSYLCYTLSGGSPVPVTFISKASAPTVVTSGAEYIAQINAARQSDSLSESLSSGGAIALKLSYKGTSASAVVDATSITITVVGGAGTSPGEIKFSDWPTMASLSGYLNSLTGFKAAPGTAVVGQQPSSSLDKGTFTIGSTFGAYSGQIKQDAYKVFTNIANNGLLVQLAAQATAGQPAPIALGYLSGGSRGATTDAIYDAAIDSLEMVRGNFLIPCFSRDAVDDIADNLTDTSSSYTLANVNAYALSHTLKMSTVKRRRNRQVFLSAKGSFLAVRSTAANIASYRASMYFQDMRDVGANGIVQYQPWMTAIKAASMQAAAFYRPIVHKGINCSGVLQAAGDFNDQSDTNLEDALLSGLLPVQREETGGFMWVSDQTTYGKDNNFSFNSIQATYCTDVVALTCAQRMEKAFVGQSSADVTASLGKTVLEGILDEMFRLKLLAPSDDAPKGYLDPSCKIKKGGVMACSVKIKLSGAIYFVTIGFTVSAAEQTA